MDCQRDPVLGRVDAPITRLEPIASFRFDSRRPAALAVLRFVVLDRFLQLAVLLAGQPAQFVERSEVLKLNPRHFGALSGLGQIYVALEDYEQALAWFRRARTI